MNLFSNIHNDDLLGFRRGAGLDYASVAEFLELGKKDLSKIAGVAESTVRFDERLPAPIKERLDEIANICQLVAEHFKDPYRTALWFKTSNPLLGNVEPRDMIRLGRYKKLLQFIVDARKEAGVGEEA